MKNIKRNKKISLRHQGGIALITTIILTSIMLTSVVLVSREMIDEVRNSTRIDNSLTAYYAAEAGLEDALLEWRYNHDAEISQENDSVPEPNSIDVTATSYNTPRTVNLLTNARGYVPSTDPNKYTTPYYELTMWSKVDQISNQQVLQDDAYEFTIENMQSNSLVLRWQNIDDGNSIYNDNGYRVEITVYDEKGNLVNPDYTKGFSCPPNDTDRDWKLIKSSLYPLGDYTSKRIIRIKPWYTKNSLDNCATPPTGGDGLNTDGTIPGTTIGNNIPGINLNITKSTTNDKISYSTANIESVGYYGGVARKIIATIDKRTGNISNIFDYAIYSGSNLIK